MTEDPKARPGGEAEIAGRTQDEAPGDPFVADQDPEFVHRAFSSIAKRYVLANHCLSFGMDLLWRRRVARIVAECRPRLVLDVATGSGDLAFAVRRAVPEATVVGTDFCAPMLVEAAKRGLALLFVADGLALPMASESVDALTVGYGLRNMAGWGAALAEFRRVLKPGGLLVVLDFSLPRAAWLREPYRLYLHHVLPRIAALITGNREAYAYLGDSIERFPSGGAMRRLVESRGYDEVRCLPLLGGISSVYTARRAG